jgi:SARP family transcriptional regulator, regulator of embCAB operon
VADADITARHTVTGLVPRPRTAQDAVSVRFALLGPLAVHRDDSACSPPEPQLQQMLALLLLRAGRLVHTDSIAHEVWGARPPADARTRLQELVSQLRRYTEETGLTSSGRRLLSMRQSSYLLKVEPRQIDVIAFRESVRHGQEAFRSRQYERAAGLLRTGLNLWAGTPPLRNVPCGPVLSSYVVKLEQEYRTARHLRIQAEIEAGRTDALIAELRGLVRADPLDEGAVAQLMQVLGRAGRRSEALTVYRALRERLVDELGLEPCESVQEQRDHLLRAGLTLR